VSSLCAKISPAAPLPFTAASQPVIVEGQGFENLMDCIIGSVGTFVEQQLTFRRFKGGMRTTSNGSIVHSITLSGWTRQRKLTRRQRPSAMARLITMPPRRMQRHG